MDCETIPTVSDFQAAECDEEIGVEYTADLDTPLSESEEFAMDGSIKKKDTSLRRGTSVSTASMSSSLESESSDSSDDDEDEEEGEERKREGCHGDFDCDEDEATNPVPDMSMDYDDDEATDRVPDMMDDSEKDVCTRRRGSRKSPVGSSRKRVSFEAMSLRSPKSLLGDDIGDMSESESGSDQQIHSSNSRKFNEMDFSFGGHVEEAPSSHFDAANVDADLNMVVRKETTANRRRKSKVRFGSIVLNELQVEALQEEIEAQEKKKSWIQRNQERSRRRSVQKQVQKQMSKLHKAHQNNTLLNKEPDEREQTKKLTTNMYPSPTGEGLSVSVKFTGKESQSFYTKLESFTAFMDVTKDEYFQLAPKDWHVVITDVKGSTKAIEAGRYKDVNTVGAASISVVMKLLDDDFPYVFGGDGATLLVPPTDIGRVLEVLLRLQRLSEEQFDLGLRVGHIQVSDVVKAGGRIEVAKHELTAGRCVAVFRGGGLNVAERCIKGQEDKYCLHYKSSEDVDLEGLSCRWNSIPSKRGKIMSLLVCARDEENPTEVYDHVLQELDKIYDGKLDEANPVNGELMSYKRVAQIVSDEKRYTTNKFSSAFIGRIVEIFLAVGIFKYDFDPKIFDHKHYFESMRPHADHRKFDDMLRMIIDCSEDQAEEIEALMEDMYMDGQIHYGIFLSDTALMTCYLDDGLDDGQHIHFIDGGDGGYAMAAKQLKAQIKSDLHQD